MKRLIAIILSCTITFTACDMQSTEDNTLIPEAVLEQSSAVDDLTIIESEQKIETVETEESEEPVFLGLDDKKLLQQVEDSVYTDLITKLNSEDYFVENVEAVYFSKEYIDEVAFNSQENIYFGYSLSELEEQFQGTKYIFSVDEDGNTTVKEFEAYAYTFEQVLKNVVTGTGVILVCVTVSVVSGVAGISTVNAIFAASAKTGAIFAASNGVFSGAAAGIVTGMRTKAFDKALEAAALVGSDSFKWAAIAGTIVGGTGKSAALHGEELKGLTLKQAAAIQKKSKYPLSVLKQFSSVEEYEACKSAGLEVDIVNEKVALVQEIDLEITDEFGNTNYTRMQNGYAPVDLLGDLYELHPIGQDIASPLAVLTKVQHDNIHISSGYAKIETAEFEQIKQEFWKSMAIIL